MVGGRADHQLKIVPLGPWMGPMCGPYVPLSDVARVAKLGGQAGGKGLHQGGKRIHARPEAPAAYWPGL